MIPAVHAGSELCAHAGRMRPIPVKVATTIQRKSVCAIFLLTNPPSRRVILDDSVGRHARLWQVKKSTVLCPGFYRDIKTKAYLSPENCGDCYASTHIPYSSVPNAVGLAPR